MQVGANRLSGPQQSRRKRDLKIFYHLKISQSLNDFFPAAPNQSYCLNLKTLFCSHMPEFGGEEMKKVVFIWDSP